MTWPPLVLDTNVYSYEPIDRLKQLHERGLRLRVSDVAFQEALAASVREYQRGMPLKRARGKFFGRAKAVAPYIDREKPIEVTSSAAIGEIRARVDSVPLAPEDAAYIRRMNAFWPKIIGPGMHDKEWVVNGQSAQEFLDLRDKVLIGLGRHDKDIRTGKPPDRYETWDSLNEEEQFTYLYDYQRMGDSHRFALVIRELCLARIADCDGARRRRPLVRLQVASHHDLPRSLEPPAHCCKQAGERDPSSRRRPNDRGTTSEARFFPL